MTRPHPTPSATSGLTPDEAAAFWLARQDAGLTATEQAEFDAWFLADPRHVAAWEEAEAAWHAFDLARRTGEAPAMVAELARRKFHRRWRRAFGAVAVAGAVAAAFLLIPRAAPPNPGVLSRPELRTLADGSHVELSRDAAISIQFQPDRRQVRLTRGTALFTVAKDAARPFVVSTGTVDVQAVGTAFSVQQGERRVDVVVTEGTVAVARTAPTNAGPVSASPPQSVLVASGNRIMVPLGPVSAAVPKPVALSAEEMTRQLAWREPRIELDGTRLADAAALFNQVNRLQLKVTDRDLADLRLSGVYRADDAEGFLRLLATNYGVLYRRDHDQAELVGRRATQF